jgi:hypothetical protein
MLYLPPVTAERAYGFAYQFHEDVNDVGLGAAAGSAPRYSRLNCQWRRASAAVPSQCVVQALRCRGAKAAS